MLLDRAKDNFSKVLEAQNQQTLLKVQPDQLPLFALLNAMDTQSWHPGLTLVLESGTSSLYAYFRSLEGLDSHPLDKYWQFEPQLDLLPDAAEDLAAQALAEIESDSIRIMNEREGEVAPADRPIAFPLSRLHVDLTARELPDDQHIVELPDWPRQAPCLSDLSAELTVGLAVLGVSPDGAAVSLRLVNERMPERYRHVTEEAAMAAALREAADRLKRERKAEPLIEDEPVAGGCGLVHRLAQRHSDRMLAGLALLQPASWCPDLLSRLPGRSLVAVCPSLDCLAVCSPHDHAATAELSLTFLRAYNAETTCRASRLLSRPVCYDADTGCWTAYSPDSAKQEFPVPTTRAQLDEYLACLSARQLELSYRSGLASKASQVRERCHACGKAAPEPPSRLLACSGCSGNRLYCDKRCQRAHWRLHKPECGGR